MNYDFFVLDSSQHYMRQEIFFRMQKEGLLGTCMHAQKNPTIEYWLELTNAQKGWLLCCAPSANLAPKVINLCGVCWIEPWHGRTWRFDFTAFRAYFSKAPHLSKLALKWIFSNAPCDSLVGLCAKSNVHAWKLACKAGFNTLGHIPGACFNARRNKYEDAVLVLATKQDILNDT